MQICTFTFTLKSLLSIVLTLSLIAASVLPSFAQHSFISAPGSTEIDRSLVKESLPDSDDAITSTQTKPNINSMSMSLDMVQNHLKSIDELEDLDETQIGKLAEWIIKYRPYKNRDALKKTLQGSGVKGVKNHHQEIIADSFKYGINRRKFLKKLGIAAAAVTGIPILFSAAKKVVDVLSPKDWTEVRNKIKTEKDDLNQKLTQLFLAAYPEERDFIKQINSGQNVVFADYVAEIYATSINSLASGRKSRSIVNDFRNAPEMIIHRASTQETVRHVKRIVDNRRMVGLVGKIIQCSSKKPLENGLNEFDKMAIDCLALRSARKELDVINLGRKQGGLFRRLPYYWKPKSPVNTSEYAYVDLATGTNFESYLNELLEYSPKRPILLNDISPYVIRFWNTISRVLELDNIQTLDMDLRTISRKTVTQKVGTIRLQNVAPWVKDLSEEWVEQIFDLVEPGGQIILVEPLSSLQQKARSSPQQMEQADLINKVMLQDEDNAKLMLNLLKVANKQSGKWKLLTGHVGEDGRFKENQSGYIGHKGIAPKVYDTVIVFQKIPQPRSTLESTKPQQLLENAQVVYSNKFIRTSL